MIGRGREMRRGFSSYFAFALEASKRVVTPVYCGYTNGPVPVASLESDPMDYTFTHLPIIERWTGDFSLIKFHRLFEDRHVFILDE